MVTETNIRTHIQTPTPLPSMAAEAMSSHQPAHEPGPSQAIPDGGETTIQEEMEEDIQNNYGSIREPTTLLPSESNDATRAQYPVLAHEEDDGHDEDDIRNLFYPPSTATEED